MSSWSAGVFANLFVRRKIGHQLIKDIMRELIFHTIDFFSVMTSMVSWLSYFHFPPGWYIDYGFIYHFY